jgi:NADH:ubiquinone reductase (H+-translocating)
MKINVPEDRQPRVVIIGGGFGGIMLAKNLRGCSIKTITILFSPYSIRWQQQD